ncbi:MAG: acetyltransferase, ribosomal protein N-acetylase, partial [Firmicutes bacterium]|nr:acetyltransferase, ribosomal protein N-acetylase [Bacillota bacterium]
RKIEIQDSEKYLKMLNQLDYETNTMMYEPGERDLILEKVRSDIKNMDETKSLTLVVEDKVSDCWFSGITLAHNAKSVGEVDLVLQKAERAGAKII